MLVGVTLWADVLTAPLSDTVSELPELIACTRREQQNEEIDHPGHGDFRLADANCLHEYDIEARGLAHEQGLACAPGDATDGAP